MMKITEEQKILLSCYKGERKFICHELQIGINNLKTSPEDPELLELLENLLKIVVSCSDDEFPLLCQDTILSTYDLEEQDYGSQNKETLVQKKQF